MSVYFIPIQSISLHSDARWTRKVNLSYTTFVCPVLHPCLTDSFPLNWAVLWSHVKRTKLDLGSTRLENFKVQRPLHGGPSLHFQRPWARQARAISILVKKETLNPCTLVYIPEYEDKATSSLLPGPASNQGLPLDSGA